MRSKKSKIDIEFSFGTNKDLTEFALIVYNPKGLNVKQFIQALYDWADYHEADMEKIIKYGPVLGAKNDQEDESLEIPKGQRIH